jgi:hypothetical protein
MHEGLHCFLRSLLKRITFEQYVNIVGQANGKLLTIGILGAESSLVDICGDNRFKNMPVARQIVRVPGILVPDDWVVFFS